MSETESCQTLLNLNCLQILYCKKIWANYYYKYLINYTLCSVLNLHMHYMCNCAFHYIHPNFILSWPQCPHNKYITYILCHILWFLYVFNRSIYVMHSINIVYILNGLPAWQIELIHIIFSFYFLLLYLCLYKLQIKSNLN